MNYYNHMQQVEAIRQDALQKNREREQRQIFLQQRSRTRQLSLWRVLWAWFIARRQTRNYEETIELMLRLLQPRKAKLVQNVHK